MAEVACARPKKGARLRSTRVNCVNSEMSAERPAAYSFTKINIKYCSRERRCLSRDAARHPAVVTHPVIAVIPPIAGIDML